MATQEQIQQLTQTEVRDLLERNTRYELQCKSLREENESLMSDIESLTSVLNAESRTIVNLRNKIREYIDMYEAEITGLKQQLDAALQHQHVYAHEGQDNAAAGNPNTYCVDLRNP